MSSDRVTDDELLYRRVLSGHLVREGETLRISSQAFSDRSLQPSVDRAKLCSYDPRWTQQGPRNAVVSLHAADVRSTLPRRDEQGRETGFYEIDVKPDPLPENPAHALIYASPAFATKSVFRKLLERLAQLAQIELLPDEED
jgi:hypothetical protein